MVIGELRENIRQAYRKVVGDEPPVFVVEPSKRPIFGDFSSNIALVGAEAANASPVALAQKIVSELNQLAAFQSVNVATPGFINFKVNDEFLLQTVQAIVAAPESLGKSDLGKETRVLIEFVSPNPTGPLTLANGRGAFVGEAISRVLELFGCTVMRECYINDRGGQIASLGHAILHPDDPERQYAGRYVDELRPRLKEKTAEAAGEQAAFIILEEMIKPVLKKIGIQFHQFFSEKSLYQTGVAKKTLELLKARGLVYEADGATWIATTRFGDDKDRVIIKADGEYTYLMSDIAYHSYKIARGYHRLINELGADHFTEAKSLNLIIEGVLRDQYLWGGKVDWVLHQIVRLIKDGQEIKMSKRTGSYVPLDELIDEVGSDVTRFFFLSRSTDTQLDFDLDLAKSTSSQNPVYYIQYAYARVSSIFREAKARGLELVDSPAVVLKHPVERQLLLRLLQFPYLVAEIAGSLEVHKLAHYATAVATDVHNFYEQLRVIGEDNEVAESRLLMLKAAQITLKKTLELIGISAPSRMVRSEDSKAER